MIDIDTLEDAPSRSRMARKPRFHQHFWEYYAQLDRWLRSNLGKHHDEVFSKWTKIQWLPVEYRTREFFLRRVQVEVEIVDGKLLNKRNNRFNVGYLGRGFYVHPKTQKLSYNHHFGPKPAPKVEDPSIVILGPAKAAIRQDGIWYAVEFTPIVSITQYDWKQKLVSIDTLLPKLSKTDPLGDLRNRTSFLSSAIKSKRFLSSAIKSKRQMSAKELRWLGLKNRQ